MWQIIILILIFVVAILVISGIVDISRSAHLFTGRGDPLEYLIFGAGIEGIDVESWNDYFKDKNAHWIGYTIGVEGNKCINGDFNSTNDLDSKLIDGFYDVIMFDWSTAKFINWNEDILKILRKKLKDNGTLLIPLESGIEIDSTTVPKISEYNNLHHWYYENFHRERIIQRKLLNGRLSEYLLKSKLNIKDPEAFKLWDDMYWNDVIKRYNLLLLKSIFGESSYNTSDYPINNERSSMHTGKIDKRNVSIKTYYKATKKAIPPDSKELTEFIKELDPRTADLQLTINSLLPDKSSKKFQITGVTRTSTVLDLKKEIEKKSGIPVNKQRLIFAGKQLSDEQQLYYYQILKEEIVGLVVLK